MTKWCLFGASRDRAFLALAFFALLAWPVPAYAYIDPGAGSMAYQAMAALIVGGAFFVRRLAGHSRSIWRALSGRSRSTPPRV